MQRNKNTKNYNIFGKHFVEIIKKEKKKKKDPRISLHVIKC